MNLWKKNFPVKRCLASFLLSESNSLAKSLTGASATYNKQAPFSITYRLKTLKNLTNLMWGNELHCNFYLHLFEVEHKSSFKWPQEYFGLMD